MDSGPQGNALKFGKLRARFYRLCAQRKTEEIGRFAGKAHLLVFRGREPYALAKEMEQHETKRIDSLPG